LSAAEQRSGLSSIERHTFDAFDLDDDAHVSQREFAMAPVFLHVLDSKLSRKAHAAFFSAASTHADAVHMRTVLRSAIHWPVAAAGDDDDADATPLLLEKFAGLGALAAQAAGAAATAATTGGAAASTSAAAANAPKVVKYGVPTATDESCVMCQYFVQRTAVALYNALAVSSDEVFGGGNAASEKVSALRIRETNAKILATDNGRGQLRLVVQDSLLKLCAPTAMPELFYGYCKSLEAKVSEITQAMSFQFAPDAVCVEAKLCGVLSYMAQKTSVHAPNKSKVSIVLLLY
jgi:hypothetical protein